MTSDWDSRVQKSNYHFDNFKFDKEVDKCTKLGRFIGDFSSEVSSLIQSINLNTLPKDVNQQAHFQEIISNMSLESTNQLKKIYSLFALENAWSRIHVQMPGQTWNLHIDKLQKMAPDNPWRIIRLVVHLTDWEQGHFWSYGNYMYSQWRAGDVHTFDWQNLPHSTANAGHNPRVSYQITGVLTEQSDEFINRLKRFETYNLDL
jgi:hypothetical protein